MSRSLNPLTLVKEISFPASQTASQAFPTHVGSQVDDGSQMISAQVAQIAVHLHHLIFNSLAI